MVTLREGGQSLDVDAEQLGEGLRLGVTELGELGRALAAYPSRWRAVTRAAVRSATGAFASGICS